MELARVIGSAVATTKTPGLAGRTFLVVQPVTTDDQADGSPFVAVDRVGAGTGEVVLVARGSAARIGIPAEAEIDAAVVAIVDRVDLDRSTTYRKA